MVDDIILTWIELLVVMISGKMLVAEIDEKHKGDYDFLCLPIDFKNKCNMGHAFVNMVSPLQIVPFQQTFNGKIWEKFNSGKVASLAYPEIQGKSALASYMQNPSPMKEEKQLFPEVSHHDEGQDSDDHVGSQTATRYVY